MAINPTYTGYCGPNPTGNASSYSSPISVPTYQSGGGVSVNPGDAYEPSAGVSVPLNPDASNFLSANQAKWSNAFVDPNTQQSWAAYGIDPTNTSERRTYLDTEAKKERELTTAFGPLNPDAVNIISLLRSDPKYQLYWQYSQMVVAQQPLAADSEGMHHGAQQIGDAGTMLGQAVNDVTGGVGEWAGNLARVPLDAVGALFTNIGTGITNLFSNTLGNAVHPATQPAYNPGSLPSLGPADVQAAQAQLASDQARMQPLLSQFMSADADQSQAIVDQMVSIMNNPAHQSAQDVLSRAGYQQSSASQFLRNVGGTLAG